MKTYVPVVAGPFATWKAAFETMWHEHMLVSGDKVMTLSFDYDVRRIGQRWFVLNRTHRPHIGRRFRRAWRLAYMPEWRRRRQPTPMTAHEAARRRDIARWAES